MKTSTYTYLALLLFSLCIIIACQDRQKDKQAAPAADSTNSTTASSVPDSPAIVSPRADPEDTITVADGESVNPADEKDSVTYCIAKKFYEKNGHTYIDADFIQFYVGDKAVEIARKYNDEVLDDYYILNENPMIRSLVIADDATYMIVRNAPGRLVSVAAPRETLLKRFQGSNNMYVLTIDKNTNTITKIKEQYLP